MQPHPDQVLEALREVGRALHLSELTQLLHVHPKRAPKVLEALEALAEHHLVKSLPGERFRASRTPGTYREALRKSAARTPEPVRAAVPVLPDRTRAARPALAERMPTERAPVERAQSRFEAPMRPAQPLPVGRGRIVVHPRGFAFVSVADGGPDVFVSPENLGPSLHGDEVEVEMRPSSRGREGNVIGIAARREPRITGTLRRKDGELVFEPDDPRLRRPMLIEGALPIEPQAGEAYVAEIVGFPQDERERAIVNVGEKLGPQGETATEIAKILVREGVESAFPKGVTAEAKRIPKKVVEADWAGREDFRELDIVTIDPDDARDHDDALYAERTSEGYRIVIAIADVSHYVREGTEIDDEAQLRGTSIYLPTHVIPMLPHEISSRIASLVPNEDRLCLGVEVALDEHGHILHYRLFEGVMRSHARLTYGQVAKTLGLTNEGRRSKDAEQRKDMLAHMLDVSRLRRKIRQRRGAIDFDLPEPRLKFEEGEPVDVVRSRKDPGVREAYRLVEEMMLLANEIVAHELKRKHVPGIYRIHGKPDERKLELFCRLATALGHPIEIEDALHARTLARFIDKLGERPETSVLRYLLLRAMQQASYDTNGEIGHFGLAADDYLHFTSPIRRYPDLAVHRIVRSLVRAERIDAVRMRSKHRKQASDSSRLERRSMNVERDVLELYRALLMRDRVDEIFEGVVTSLDPDGYSVTLDEPFVDVRVDLASLALDRFELDDLGVRLVNRAGFGWELGDRIRVRVTEIDLGERRVRGRPEDLPIAKRMRPKRASEATPARRPVSRAEAKPRSKHATREGFSAPIATREERAEVRPKRRGKLNFAHPSEFVPAAPVIELPEPDDAPQPATFDERAWQARLKAKKARRASKRDADGARTKPPRS